MLTARGSTADRSRGDAAGADAYQVKPFSTQDLLEQVRKLLANEGLAHAP
jgi:DNA-binding response OmpR family regulator